jgi:diguanylate cyclase (GGDEF)-like protein
MEPSQLGRAVRAGALVLGAALAAAVVALTRSLPGASVSEAGLGWMVQALAIGLIVAGSGAGLSMLVLALRSGSLAAALSTGASAALAGGAVGALAGARMEVPVAGAALLLLGAALGERGSTLLAGRRGRIGAVTATLALAEVLVVIELLPGTSAFVDLARPGIAWAAAGASALAALLVSGRPAGLVAAGLAVAGGGLAVGRPDGPELAVVIAVLAGSQLAAVAARPGSVEPPAMETTERLPDLAGRVSDAVLRFDGHLQLRDWNGRAAALLGLDEASAGARIEDLIGVRLAELPPDEAAVHLGTRVGGIDVVLLRNDGGVTAIIRDPEGTPETERLGRELRGTIEELLQARRTIELQRQEIERSSATDAVTGIATRSALLDRLRTEIAQARRYAHPVALVLLDVDGFSDHNHALGTEAGDAILKELALRIRLRIRQADALGRAGSDSFLAVLPHTDEAGAASFADALQRRVGLRPIAVGAAQVTVTVSVGVAVIRSGEELDLDGVLARVEEALASAERAGGNRIALDRLHGLARLDDRRRLPPARPTDEDIGGA